MTDSFLWRGFDWPRSDRKRLNRRLLRHPAVFVASVGGAGFLPIAPGTFGSLLGIALGWICRDLALTPTVAIFALLIAIGAWAAGRTAMIIGEHDHSIIVCDETFAMALVCVSVPDDMTSIVAGFLLFRLFDVVKPWPSNVVEARALNGFGVMGDDLVAAAYAIGIVQGAHHAVIALWY